MTLSWWRLEMPAWFGHTHTCIHGYMVSTRAPQLTSPPLHRRTSNRFRRLRSMAMKGSELVSIRSSHTAALLPRPEICVSHVDGVASFIRLPANRESKLPGSPLASNSARVCGYLRRRQSAMVSPQAPAQRRRATNHARFAEKLHDEVVWL